MTTATKSLTMFLAICANTSTVWAQADSVAEPPARGSPPGKSIHPTLPAVKSEGEPKRIAPEAKTNDERRNWLHVLGDGKATLESPAVNVWAGQLQKNQPLDARLKGAFFSRAPKDRPVENVVSERFSITEFKMLKPASSSGDMWLGAELEPKNFIPLEERLLVTPQVRILSLEESSPFHPRGLEAIEGWESRGLPRLGVFPYQPLGSGPSDPIKREPRWEIDRHPPEAGSQEQNVRLFLILGSCGLILYVFRESLSRGSTTLESGPDELVVRPDSVGSELVNDELTLSARDQPPSE